MQFIGIAASTQNLGGRPYAKIYRGTNPTDIRMDPSLSWDLDPLRLIPTKPVHDFNGFITRLIQSTTQQLTSFKSQTGLANLQAPYVLPIGIALPHEYHQLQLTEAVKLASGGDPSIPVTLGEALSLRFHHQFNEAIPGREDQIKLAPFAYEYSTLDNDIEFQYFPFADDLLLQQSREFQIGFIRKLAYETGIEMLRNHGGNSDLLEHYGVIHWGRIDRPLYRLIHGSVELTKVFTDEVKRVAGMDPDQELILSFPHSRRDNYIDDVVVSDMREQMRACLGAETIELKSAVQEPKRNFYAVAVSVRGSEYQFTVLRADASGQTIPDPELSWTMPSGNITGFLAKMDKSILAIVEKSRDELPNRVIYRVPVYVSWPFDSKFSEFIEPARAAGIDLQNHNPLLEACFASIHIKLQGLGYDPAKSILINRDPALVLHPSTQSFAVRATAGLDQDPRVSQETIRFYCEQAKAGDKRSMRALVRLARINTMAMAEEVKDKYKSSGIEGSISKVFTIGATKDDWLLPLLDFPQVRRAIAEELVRIFELPYKASELVIRYAGDPELDPTTIVSQQMQDQINLIEKRPIVASTEIDPLAGLYDDDPVAVREPSSNKLRRSLEAQSIAKFYGVGISGFTDKVSFSALSGHSPNDIELIPEASTVWGDHKDLDARFHEMARRLVYIAKQQELEEAQLGISNYQIPIAIGWPCNDKQEAFWQKVKDYMLANSSITSNVLNSCDNSWLAAFYLAALVKHYGLQSPQSRFDIRPRGFCSVAGEDFEHRKATAEYIHSQFLAQINEGWDLYKRGKHAEAYQILRIVTEKCADLYLNAINLKRLAPGFAMFGSTFDKKAVRQFKFLQLYDLKRVFEKIVERGMMGENQRFKLKLRGDKKEPQYSDPVRSHIIEAMVKTGYLNNLFELVDAK